MRRDDHLAYGLRTRYRFLSSIERGIERGYIMTNPRRDGASMVDRMPAEVTLQAIGLSFSLPAGKNLSQTWQRELRTQMESRLSVRVSRERLEMSFNPAILIDAQWPAMNMELGGASIEFSTAKISATLGSIYGVTEGLVDLSQTAKKEVCALIATGIAGTSMARPGYDPLTDRKIISTLEAIADNFRRLPSSGQTDVTTGDFGNPRINMTLAMAKKFEHLEDGAGLSIPEGTVIDIGILGQGNLASIAATRNLQDQAMAAKVNAVTMSSKGILVVVKDKPIAYLDQLRIARGGPVKLEKMRLAGIAGEVEGMESLFRVIGIAIATTQSGASIDSAIAIAARSPAAEAHVIPDLVRGKIEATLTRGVQQIIRAHKQTIPEMDLEEVFVA